MNRYGAGSGHPLDYTALASHEIGGALEPKICELCGRQFFRVAPQEIEKGQKYCRPCVIAGLKR